MSKPWEVIESFIEYLYKAELIMHYSLLHSYLK